MAEVIYPARVTNIRTKLGIHDFVEVYVHLLTDDQDADPKDRVLNTGIPSKNEQNKCGIPKNSNVSVYINERQPTKIVADACKACPFTIDRGEILEKAPEFVCIIYKRNEKNR